LKPGQAVQRKADKGFRFMAILTDIKLMLANMTREVKVWEGGE